MNNEKSTDKGKNFPKSANHSSQIRLASTGTEEKSQVFEKVNSATMERRPLSHLQDVRMKPNNVQFIRSRSPIETHHDGNPTKRQRAWNVEENQQIVPFMIERICPTGKYIYCPRMAGRRKKGEAKLPRISIQSFRKSPKVKRQNMVQTVKSQESGHDTDNVEEDVDNNSYIDINSGNVNYNNDDDDNDSERDEQLYSFIELVESRYDGSSTLLQEHTFEILNPTSRVNSLSSLQTAYSESQDLRELQHLTRMETPNCNLPPDSAFEAAPGMDMELDEGDPSDEIPEIFEGGDVTHMVSVSSQTSDTLLTPPPHTVSVGVQTSLLEEISGSKGNVFGKMLRFFNNR